MDRRAATAAATRERILEATVWLYRQQGLGATTIEQVARRASVAPGTVIHHFGTARGLTAAALDRVALSLELPTTAIFAGVPSGGERLRRLVMALYAFYDRSSDWFRVLQADQSEAAYRDSEARFWASMSALYDAALGDIEPDPTVRATVVGLTGPATYIALRQAGLATGAASAVVGEMLARLVDEARIAIGEEETR